MPHTNGFQKSSQRPYVESLLSPRATTRQAQGPSLAEDFAVEDATSFLILAHRQGTLCAFKFG